MVNMAAAMALAIVIGFVMGSIIHALPRLRKIVDPLLGAYYAVPHFILYPLLIVMFGLGQRAADCHWHHLRCGRHGGQHDRRPRSHPARFSQDRRGPTVSNPLQAVFLIELPLRHRIFLPASSWRSPIA